MNKWLQGLIGALIGGIGGGGVAALASFAVGATLNFKVLGITVLGFALISIFTFMSQHPNPWDGVTERRGAPAEPAAAKQQQQPAGGQS